MESPLPRWALRYMSHDGGTCLGHCLPHLHFPMLPPGGKGGCGAHSQATVTEDSPQRVSVLQKGRRLVTGPGKRVVMGLDDGNVCPQLALVTGERRV